MKARIAQGSKHTAQCLLVLFGLALSPHLFGQAITEFPLPTADSGPAHIAAGPDGALWFTEEGSNKIGRITTAGAVSEFSIPTAGSFPSGIGPGTDGAMWFTEQSSNQIGRITTDGVITEFSIPTAGSQPWGIVAGADGALWFTESGAPKVGRITTDGEVAEFNVPNPSSFGALRGITAGPDGALWFMASEGGIGRITTTGAITRFPPYVMFSDVIAAGGDGALWFPSCSLFPRLSCKINRMTTEGAITGFPIGSGINGFNGGITRGPDDAIWITERYGNSIGRVTFDGAVTHFPIPTTDSFPSGIAAGPDGAIWFTEHDANKIGRIGAAMTCAPSALCLESDQFRVGVAWRGPDGSSGTGHAVRLTAESGYFWFFDSNNIEVVVKTLNGCGVNNHYWVFAGGLTNVEVTMTVTESSTGQSKSYINLQGSAFQPVVDTSTFAGCPAGPD